MKVSKYYPFAFVYFFVNAVGLPFGLLYTIILTPIFYLWIIIKGKRLILFKFFALATPFIIVHLINGVDIFQYAKSWALFFTVYIFCYSFYTLITWYDGIEEIFKKISIANFLLTIVALFFVFTSFRSVFWDAGHWATNSQAWPRLSMLTYEASYYATLLVPIFAFYFIPFILRQNMKKSFIQLLVIAIPLILTLSLGVIGSLFIATVMLILLNIRRFLTSKRLLYSLVIIATIGFVAFIFLIVFYRDNPLFSRAASFVMGNDQSGRGRTTEAFYLGYTIADLKSISWGVGPGQLKIIGDSVIRSFYLYPASITQVSIPNALAETLTLFGLIGALLRLSVEMFLFFRTKVLSNYYRSFLFFFIFIYQFTGSFTTNIAEYVIWILAFTNVFPKFDRSYRQQGKLDN